MARPSSDFPTLTFLNNHASNCHATMKKESWPHFKSYYPYLKQP